MSEFHKVAEELYFILQGTGDRLRRFLRHSTFGIRINGPTRDGEGGKRKSQLCSRSRGKKRHCS
jgi:hypothetical protein